MLTYPVVDVVCDPDTDSAEEAEEQPEQEEIHLPEVATTVHYVPSPHVDEGNCHVLDGLHRSIGCAQLVICHRKSHYGPQQATGNTQIAKLRRLKQPMEARTPRKTHVIFQPVHVMFIISYLTMEY